MWCARWDGPGFNSISPESLRAIALELLNISRFPTATNTNE